MHLNENATVNSLIRFRPQSKTSLNRNYNNRFLKIAYTEEVSQLTHETSISP
jgi:hypothetical protein